MKKLFFCLTFSVWLFGFSYDVKPLKVENGVYCIFGEPGAPDTKNNGNIVNSCYIELEDGILAIDTGPTYIYAKEAATTIEKELGKKITLVINTHYHNDHLGGNSYYRERKIKIIGDTKIKEAYERIPERFSSYERVVSKEAWEKSIVTLPDEYIDKNITIKAKHGELTVFKPSKKAHTAADIVIYYPSAKTVIAGDIAYNQMIVPIRDGSVKGSIEALQEIGKLEFTHIIGGHGKTIGRESYDFALSYMTKLRNGVKSALNKGVELDGITKAVDMSEFKNAALWDENPKNIIVAFQEMEME